MRKKEAAEFLGVSTRTLERLVKEGRLRARREKGKTRPLVVFDKEDLERLKTAREEEKPPEAFGRPNTSQSLGGIGFRLDHVYIKMLEEQGESQRNQRRKHGPASCHSRAGRC
jgi:excisionase family DNA binding protein